MKFVDANVFLRAMTGDDPAKAAASAQLFREVDLGHQEITTCEAVIAEVVYVLSGRGTYGLSHSDVRARLAPFLRLRGVRLPQKRLYLEALDLYATHAALDFEDALCVVHMKHAGLTDLLSYDQDFDRIPEITRTEP